MAYFTVRVELKGDPSFQQYENLHALMARLGFGRTVTSEGGTYDLPHATYYGVSLKTASEARDLVRDNVRRAIQDKFLVYVAETTLWALGW
jgi:hypothetical protein